jgi:hypothetical protein
MIWIIFFQLTQTLGCQYIFYDSFSTGSNLRQIKLNINQRNEMTVSLDLIIFSSEMMKSGIIKR